MIKKQILFRQRQVKTFKSQPPDSAVLLSDYFYA